MEELEEIRGRIRTLDEQLVDLVEQRVEAAREAGHVKRDNRVAIRDYDAEREVVARLREGFEDRGLDPELGADIARILIREALRAQERDGLQPTKGPRGRALIVGGAGKMGAWLAHFLNGVGYEVIINDVAGPLEGFAFTTDPVDTADAVDVVLLATPPAVTGPCLEDLAGVDALLMDIASLKSPFEDTLERLAEDQPVTSVHPLWGPGTRVLSGKNLLVLDCGNREANERARELFGLSAANVVTLPLDAHDELMALTLNLPHALNLVYAEVLDAADRSFEELAEAGGPTFLKQTDVAAEVSRENPELYRQIQALNDETPRVYEALHDAIEALDDRVDDPKAFTGAMERYRELIGGFQGGLLP